MPGRVRANAHTCPVRTAAPSPFGRLGESPQRAGKSGERPLQGEPKLFSKRGVKLVQAAADKDGEDLRTDGPAAASLAARPSDIKGPFPGALFRGPRTGTPLNFGLDLQRQAVDR